MDNLPGNPQPPPPLSPPPSLPPPQGPPVYRKDGSSLVVVAVVVPLVVVFVLGVLAAVAIPAFMKYTRRAKTTEAQMNVRRIAQQATAYYEEHHALPPSVDWTPAGSPCTHGGMKFAPDPAAWRQPTWEALGFSVDDPHYYQYRFTVEGGEVVAQAQGDLDCDEKYSLFERRLQVTPGGLAGGAGLYVRDEIE